MSAHDLNDRDTFVRGHRIAQLIYYINASIYGSVEAERVIGIFKVVVYRAGNTYRGNAVFFREALRAPERTVAAYNYKPFDTSRFESLNSFFLSCLSKHFKTSGGS